ncbi:hypothetical protein JTB14_038210 [Gonioctena quinquepunctata]|nr:hypothetical protein JTB14_038210 [Gonioctena quinquepunctata]
MDQSLEKWMNNNPGQTVSKFQIRSIFSDAYLKASVSKFAAKEVTEYRDETGQETIQNTGKHLRTSGEKPPTRSSPIAGPRTRSDTPPILEHPASDESTVEAESSFTVTPADSLRELFKNGSLSVVCCLRAPPTESFSKKRRTGKLKKKKESDKSAA